MPHPTEHDIYVVAISLMAALFVASLIRLWLNNRFVERLEKSKATLASTLAEQVQEVQTLRKDSGAWRDEMQRQFDGFRHLASEQFNVAESRFASLQNKSAQREYELLTALDLARQMCQELPAAKAQILHLESLLATVSTPPPPEAASDSTLPRNDGGRPIPLSSLAPMPDLDGGNGAPLFPRITAPARPPVPALTDLSAAPAKAAEHLQEQLDEAHKRNAHLQQALTMTRLRTRPHSAARRLRGRQQA